MNNIVKSIPITYHNERKYGKANFDELALIWVSSRNLL